MKNHKTMLSALLALLLAVVFILPGAMVGATEPATENPAPKAENEVTGTPSTEDDPLENGVWSIKPHNGEITFNVKGAHKSLEYQVKCDDTVVYDKLGGTVTGEDDNYYQKVRFVSKNAKVAKVENGEIVSVGRGHTTITGTLTDHPEVAAAVWDVTVDVPADALELDYNGGNMLWVGGGAKYVGDLVNWSPEDANVKWSSSNSKVAEVKGDKVNPKSKGSFKLKGSDGKNEDEKLFRVNQFYCSGWSNKAKSMPKWKKESKVTLDVTFKAEYDDELTYDRFTDAYVDGDLLTDGTEYTTEEGSVIIKLKPEYLEKLPLKKHTLKAEFQVYNIDGELLTLYVEQEFKIVDSSSSVDTADTTFIGLGVFLFLLSLTYVALFTYDKKSRKFRRRRMAPVRRRY